MLTKQLIQGASVCMHAVPCCLQVVTYTSHMRGAGTDACPYVELIDSNGASSGRKQLLTSAPDAFERGKVDEFRIKCQAVGNLVKLKIGHDGRGAKPAWHLSKVRRPQIREARLSRLASQQLESCVTCPQPLATLHMYLCWIFAAGPICKLRCAAAGCGVEQHAHLNLHDMQLLDAGLKPMLPVLLQVEVTDVATGKVWYFAAECWLDATQGDRATLRLLLASDKDPWADMTSYKVGRAGAGHHGAVGEATEVLCCLRLLTLVIADMSNGLARA